jgi:molybdate transport system regulatory protein
MAKYPGLLLRILTVDGPAFGPGRAQLIAAIDAEGSISAAARTMGMSYRRAWQLVESVNASFAEAVVVTETGGRKGGGARVTPFGRELVARYRSMEEKASAAIGGELAEIERRLRSPGAR